MEITAHQFTNNRTWRCYLTEWRDLLRMTQNFYFGVCGYPDVLPLARRSACG